MRLNATKIRRRGLSATFPKNAPDLGGEARRLLLTLGFAWGLVGATACHAAEPTPVGADARYRRAAAELRKAIERGDVERLVGALAPDGLKVGDASMTHAAAAADLRQKGTLHAKFFDTARRRQAAGASPLASQILSVRDWFLDHPDAEMVVEHQGPEVLVWFRPKGSRAELDDLMPCFTFCDHGGQPKLCRPPDDT